MPKIYVQFKNLNDFVRLITLSPTPFINYIKLNGHEVYFIQIVGLGERVLYYIELDKKLDQKYIVYNRFRDTLTFSNKFESDGQSVSIPILEVERTNVFSEYPPE